jgi:hypothetical protein
MQLSIDTTQVRLARRDLLPLDPPVHRVVCESGSLWITQDRDARDILLEPGEAFTPDPARRAIVYALSTAALTVERAAPKPLPVPARWRPARPHARSLVLE